MSSCLNLKCFFFSRTVDIISFDINLLTVLQFFAYEHFVNMLRLSIVKVGDKKTLAFCHRSKLWVDGHYFFSIQKRVFIKDAHTHS